MKLDRGLIKQQARALIKDKVMKLFITSFVVTICISLIFLVLSGVSAAQSAYEFDDFFDSSDYGSDYDYYDDFDGEVSEYGNDFYNFNAKIPVVTASYYTNPSADFAPILGLLGYISVFLLAPLEVALAAFYVSFIRGKEYEMGAGIKYVFNEAFKSGYGKKLGVFFIRGILTALLSCIFYIPGIIFYYSSYFSYQIMCDYPELSPWQAIKLSKKIVEGSRTELFVLELSFIPWHILSCFVFPLIYVIPYIQTTQALYYENFRLRAIQLGKVTEDDFLSDAQKAAKYSSNQQPFANGYQPQGNNYNSEQPVNNYGSPSQNFGANTPNGAQPQQGGPNPAAQPQPYPSAQPTYFTPAVQSPIQPAYYSPEIPKAPDPEQPVDIYTPLTKDTVNPPEDEPVPKITEADVTIIEPEEPSSPELIEPQEPTDAFTEPEEAPAEASEPKPLTDDGSDVDL